MSDFLYSSKPIPPDRLGSLIQAIYHSEAPSIHEFHGNWGSLAVSENLYQGLQPLETQEYIFIVIGGPVLCWRDNDFLVGKDSTKGTRAILERWQAGTIQWDEDLSGPFVIIAINKKNNTIQCITDLMLFIPVYLNLDAHVLSMGTHVDALAKLIKQNRQLDPVSITDFILNGIITYPFTLYTGITQKAPATDYTYRIEQNQVLSRQEESYWLPYERQIFNNINQAASALSEGIQEYVAQVTRGMERVAQFISAGEDSRALAGLIPARLERDAFIFLDSMNREGQIAQKVARAYGAKFNVRLRNKTHYLNILPEASDLVGGGHQYIHAHTLGFDKQFRLNNYTGVFGGFLSDTLLKALHAHKPDFYKRFPFVPEFSWAGKSRSKPIKNLYFFSDTLDALNRRRETHLRWVQNIRPQSAHEWFALFPITMYSDMPNLYINRRLFRTYEPFMCKQVVKISAGVPTSWKLNRRLFHKAMMKFLTPTKWVQHADGRLPYFPWYINTPVQFANWISRQVMKKSGLQSRHPGPWADWQEVAKSEQWLAAIQEYQSGFDLIRTIITRNQPEALFQAETLSLRQKVNLLQTLYSLRKA